MLKYKLKTITITACLVSNIYADDYNYRNIIIGDRAAGLGGAYTAISDEPTGLYYNPAGIVYANGSKFSGSVTGYANKSIDYNNVFNNNQQWNRNSGSVVANFFGLFQPYKDGVIGFSIVIPDSTKEDLDGTLDGLRTSNYTAHLDYNIYNVDSTTLIGPSYAQSINDKLSIGISLYAYMRKREYTFYQNSILTHDTDSSLNTVIKEYNKDQLTATGIMPKIGLMWSPKDKYSIGLTYSKTIIFSQNPELFIDKVTYVNNVIDTDITKTVNQPKFIKLDDTEIADEITLGFANFVSPTFLYTFDYTYRASTDVLKDSWDFSAGTEYYIKPTLGVRLGAYTMNAKVPKDSSKKQIEQIDLIGLSSSITMYNKQSAISFGFNYGFGSDTNTLTNVISNDVEVSSYSLFFSTTSSF